MSKSSSATSRVLPPEMHEQAIQASPLAIYLVDPGGHVVLWNRAAAALYGWEAHEVVGRPDPSALGAPATEGSDLFALAALSGTIELEVARRTRSGESIDVALHIAPVNGGGHPAGGFVVVASDVTARRRVQNERDRALAAERAARLQAEAAERRARFLAEGSALLDASLDYEMTFGNLARLAVPTLADYCLVDEVGDDLISRIALAHADPERERLLERRMRQPIAGDPSRHPVVRVALSGESVLVEEVTGSVLAEIAHDESHLSRLRSIDLHSFMVVPLSIRGKILGMITFAYAESRRRYTGADLEMAEQLARRAALAVETARLYQASREAISARERLLAVVSHDLRNSLATVLLNSSAILESPRAATLGPPTLEQLGWIARSAEQMNRLISDLLDVTAIELGRLAMDLSPQPVWRIVRDAAEMIRPIALEKSIDLTWEADQDLPWIRADPERLLQVLGNLLGNAIKFSPVRSTLLLRAYSGETDEIRFDVVDEGPGIAPEYLTAIFDLYWQGDRRRGIGAGLGLAIAKGIVEAHAGRIWVDMKSRTGSIFSFTIPVDAGLNSESLESRA